MNDLPKLGVGLQNWWRGSETWNAVAVAICVGVSTMTNLYSRFILKSIECELLRISFDSLNFPSTDKICSSLKSLKNSPSSGSMSMDEPKPPDGGNKHNYVIDW